MKKNLCLFAAAMLLCGFMLSCAKKPAQAPAPNLKTQPKIAQITPQPQTGTASPALVTPAAPKENPLPYNTWAGNMHKYFTAKKPNSIKNIAFNPPGSAPPSEVKVFVTGYSQGEAEEMAKYMAGNYKKKFPGKKVTITVLQQQKTLASVK